MSLRTAGNVVIKSRTAFRVIITNKKRFKTRTTFRVIRTQHKKYPLQNLSVILKVINSKSRERIFIRFSPDRMIHEDSFSKIY